VCIIRLHFTKLCSLVKYGSILKKFLLVFWGGVRLSPLGTSATNWPVVPTPDDDDDDDECGAVGEMRIGRGN
jgi:hypothetical protein